MRGVAAVFLSLCLISTSAQTEDPGNAIDRGFLERCLGQVEELPAWDDGVGPAYHSVNK